jgi:hypothetical protein
VSGLEIAAVAILIVGMLGYAVSIGLLWRFRAWMGGRGQGWPRILLDTLLALVVLLALLYLISLIATLGVLNRTARISLNFVMGLSLAIAPWTLAVALLRWWPAGARPRWLRWRGGDD